MSVDNRALLRRILGGIESGDASAAGAVNEPVYVQHNPLTATGGIGLAELFLKLSKMSPKVEFLRVFADREYAFAHVQYTFSKKPEVAFEVFRFEDGLAVEHWDNLQARVMAPNGSGHTMIDGMTDAEDGDRTEENRQLVARFVSDVLIAGNLDNLEQYVAGDLIQHDPQLSDGVAALRAVLVPFSESDADTAAAHHHHLRYDACHKVLADGSFCLCMCEGWSQGVHAGLYDLYRVSDGQIVEHWKTVSAIAPKSEWKNSNGKF